MDSFAYEISIIRKPTADSAYGRLVASTTLDHAADIFEKIFEIINNEAFNNEFHTVRIDIHKK